MRQRLLYIAVGLGGALGLLVVTAVGLGWSLSEPGWQGPTSDHFDGVRFHNDVVTPLPDAGKAIRMVLTAERGHWEPWTEITPAKAPPQQVTDRLQVTFVNHATVLLQLDGVNILTDPIWSERCSAVQWAGPKRHHAPGLRFEDLPPIDVVLISHNDHLDVDTLARLKAHSDPLVLAGLGNGDLLAELGLQHRELDWEDAVQVKGVRFTAEETRHFSSRGLFDRNKTLWLGFSISGETGSVYFGGDTGWGDHFANTGAARGPFDLALIPIGAFKPRWFMAPVHVDPQDAVRAHQALRSHRSIGIHHSTFRLSDEGQTDPAAQLEQAARDASGRRGSRRPRSVCTVRTPAYQPEAETGT